MFREIRTVLALAIPVALAELGWMAMSVVDTIMVGGLGPLAIGAIALGSSAFYSCAIFCTGLLLGMDSLVAQAHGAGQGKDAHRSLAAGIGLTAILGPALTGFLIVGAAYIGLAGIGPELAGEAGRFLRTLSWSAVPLMLYGALRRYLQATGSVQAITFAQITANLVNWFGNWLLIEGHWGAPALGVVGSALSTVVARSYMAGVLAFVLWRREGGRALAEAWPPDRERMGLVVRIGAPAAFQILLEVGAFNLTAFLAGRLTPVALAAHQIAINAASVSYMVPLGISSAAAITVGHAIGSGKLQLARHRGNIALGTAIAFEICSAILFVVFPFQILHAYTTDAAVVSTGLGLLALAAAFQLFDGLQTVATGALRGMGSTRPAMIVNLAGYWVLGLPLGYVLCFYQGQGVYGLWVGLTLALVLISIVLVATWLRLSSLNRRTDPGMAA